MLTKRIIPCLDINEGRVVKGVNFLNLKDAGDPVELAEYYNNQGADELVFLDITASSEQRFIIIDVVKNVSEKLFIPLTVGGGLNKISDIRTMLQAGADKVSINTSAVKTPKLISEASFFFGSQCIDVAIDVKKINRNKLNKYSASNINIDINSQWEIFTHGGRKSTGIDAIKWAIEVTRLGAGELLVTSMDTDGKKEGYDLELIKTITKNVNIPVIASGGAGQLKHLSDVLKYSNADAVLAASIFHYKTYTISEVKKYLSNLNIPIRPN